MEDNESTYLLAFGPPVMSSSSSDPWFQSLFADRIGGANYGKGTAIYKFEKIKRAKRKALADHPERKLLDFGIGENDEMAPEVVRRRMAEEINRPENRGYAAHGVLSYDREPNSILSIPGARDVGVEVHSMSKAFDMIGWRIGWVCGHERIISAYGNVKDNFDSGQ